MNNRTQQQLRQDSEMCLFPEATIQIDNGQINPRFDQVLQDALNEVFTSLGEKCKIIIYQYFETAYALSPDRIPSHIDELIHGLHQIFRDTSPILMMLIIKVLHLKVPNFVYSDETNGIVIARYLEELRSFLLINDS
jgi:hypothetical protein